MRIQTQAEIDGARLGAQIAREQAEQQFKEGVEAVKQEVEGFRMGVDLAREMGRTEENQ